MANEIDGISKVFLGLFTFLTLGTGLGAIVYGLLLLIRFWNVQYNYGNCNLMVASIFLLIVGGLLILTYLLGSFGAWKNVSTVRLATLIMALLIFVVLLTVGLLTVFLIQSGRLKQSINSEIDNFDSNYKELSPEIKSKADYLHQHFQCCSKNTSTTSDNDIPSSCCKVPGCSSSSSGENKYFDLDCREVYLSMKGKEVWRFCLVTSITAGGIFIASVVYILIYHRRTHAGYAGVSRG